MPTSSFDAWLQEEGLYQNVTTHAIKRFLLWRIEQARAVRLCEIEMIDRTHTGRT